MADPTMTPELMNLMAQGQIPGMPARPTKLYGQYGAAGDFAPEGVDDYGRPTGSVKQAPLPAPWGSPGSDPRQWGNGGLPPPTRGGGWGTGEQAIHWGPGSLKPYVGGYNQGGGGQSYIQGFMHDPTTGQVIQSPLNDPSQFGGRKVSAPTPYVGGSEGSSVPQEPAQNAPIPSPTQQPQEPRQNAPIPSPAPSPAASVMTMPAKFQPAGGYQPPPIPVRRPPQIGRLQPGRYPGLGGMRYGQAQQLATTRKPQQYGQQPQYLNG